MAALAWAKKFSHYSAAFKREVLERTEGESLSDQQAATLAPSGSGAASMMLGEWAHWRHNLKVDAPCRTNIPRHRSLKT